jgi:AmiR/NasT family two-component response regulator
VSELDLDIELDGAELGGPAGDAGGIDVAGEIDDGRAGAEPRPISVGDDQLIEVEELLAGLAEAPAEAAPAEAAPAEAAELPVLAIAVHDEPAALGAAQRAITAAGHETAIAAAGKDGLARVHAELATGVDVLLVGLPGGEPLIEAALALAPERPVVIAAVTGAAPEGVRLAAAAGADLVVMRPHDVARLAPVLLAAARLADERRRAALAGADLLRARRAALVDPEAGALQPFAVLQGVLELERAHRHGYPLSVALFAVDIPPPAPPPGVRGILRARAGTALAHALRDIDLAAALPAELARAYDSVPASDERFLVVLPYTELAGAALLAGRVIAAVAAADPVVAGGRTFSPRLVGAVAGAAPGQPVSFSRLMKDATRALEQARRDGVELAVPLPRPPDGARP